VDDFMDGRLKVIQSRAGYRFSIDAVLLCRFISTKPGDLLVDLGTGCGIIPLILLLDRPLRFAVGLEIQESLADQASRNARLNGFDDRMVVARGDIRHPPLARPSADLVVCNPPYRPKDSGRINPDPVRAAARHEILVSLRDILTAARGLLRPRGRLAMVYPAMRLADILISMRGYGLEPKRMQVVYPDPASEGGLVLLEAAAGGRKGLEILPPVVDQGEFSI
jgi:tRNA1Val (adenine37-N6)-methyltransferase